MIEAPPEPRTAQENVLRDDPLNTTGETRVVQQPEIDVRMAHRFSQSIQVMEIVTHNQLHGGNLSNKIAEF